MGIIDFVNIGFAVNSIIYPYRDAKREKEQQHINAQHTCELVKSPEETMEECIKRFSEK